MLSILSVLIILHFMTVFFAMSDNRYLGVYHIYLRDVLRGILKYKTVHGMASKELPRDDEAP